MRSDVSLFRFTTHHDGAPLTTGLVVDRRTNPAASPSDRLGDMATLANENADACAYGKIAVIAPDGIHSFQVMPDGRLSPAFCGNSTAAAIRCMQRSSELLTRVHGPGSCAYALSAQSHADRVTQSWFLPQPVFEEINWLGLKVLLVRALNDYAIVMGALPDGMSADAVRTQLLGLAGCGKLAVIDTGTQTPLVRFYNSNGRHGAAPQTGLASIALAAMQVDWMSRIFAERRVKFLTKNGLRSVDLPDIRKAGQGTYEVNIGPIAVDVSPLSREIAA